MLTNRPANDAYANRLHARNTLHGLKLKVLHFLLNITFVLKVADVNQKVVYIFLSKVTNAIFP